MGIFGQKLFVVSRSAHRAIMDCSNSKKEFDTNKFYETVRRAEGQLHSSHYAANRAEFGGEMAVFARELREVLDWVTAHPGKPFKVKPR